MTTYIKIYNEAQFTDSPNAAQIVRIYTDATLAQVQAAGFLNGAAAEGIVLSPKNKYLISYLAGAAVDFFNLAVSNGVYTLSIANTDVVLPTVAGDFAVFSNTTGTLEDLGYLPSDSSKTRVVMAGSAVVIGRIAHFVDVTGTIDDTAAAVTNAGDIYAGLDAVAGVLRSYPATTATGYLGLTAVSNSGAFNTIISNAPMGQTTTVSIPNPGAATANFVLDAGNASSLSVLNLKYGATPVAQVDPGSCTISAVAGAADTATITVQLKDGSGTNIARSVAFKVYSSSAADGLTLQSAASTGYSVASGGLSLDNGSAVTTQISAMSSATGGCVLSLLDTGKQTSYLVLVLPNGNKISAQLSAGSYG